ncbi:MAG: hypothetical protein Q9227_001346 [Pyrenula ochraceoflavens]
MATASTILLTPSTTGVYHVPNVSPASADTASKLLQENHEKYHMYFNSEGFHNHIAHHLLTIFALGATPAQLEKAYRNNAGYQRPQYPISPPVVSELHDPAKFRSYLGQEKHFHSFVEFYQQELDTKGWPQTLREHVFASPETDGGRAQELFTRLFAGFMHPLIHLGFGIEFRQPAIIAESLAQAAIHTNWLAPYILDAEIQASAHAVAGKPSSSLLSLLQAAYDDPKVRTSAHLSDDNKLRDGVLVRAGPQMTSLASQYHIETPATSATLQRATAEMTALCARFTLCAQRADKVPKVDFFYLHCLNASIFHSAFLGLSEEEMRGVDKKRLLEAKARVDLAMYVSRGAPELREDEVSGYVPEQRTRDLGWDGLFEEFCEVPDDGHAAKLGRAVANAGKIIAVVEGEKGRVVEESPVKGGEEEWVKAGRLVVDSLYSGGGRWVRNAGWEEAWRGFPGRKTEQVEAGGSRM